MASAISSIMPGVRVRSSDTAPERKGRPPQTYITEPTTGEIQPIQPAIGNG